MIPTLQRLAGAELSRTIRNPWFWASVTAVIALPTLTGLGRMGSYAITTPIDLFSLGLAYIPLIFPLLAAFVYCVSFSEQTANRFIVSTRTRVDIRTYIMSALITNASVVFPAFFLAVFAWFLLSFYIDPLMGFSSTGGLPSLTTAESANVMEEAATFTQLITVSPLLYGLVYSLWFAIWAVLFATLTLLLLVLIGNRLLALALPLIIFWVDNSVFSSVGLPQLRAVSSFYPFGLTQQPAWTAISSFVLWATATFVIAAILTRKRHSLQTIQ